MPDPVIRIEGLSFAWNGGATPVLDIERLVIAPGEKIFVQGPSGSGKTTLLSVLGAVVRPRRGVVDVLGLNLASLKSAARDRFRADHVGFIFQMFNLIPYLSMVDNVVLPCHFSTRRRDRASDRGNSPGEEAGRLLSRLAMPDDARSRPVTALSVGQQQRVAAARALIGAPEIVIADEPTSSLDADARQSFISLLFEECGRTGSTLVFVSHDQSLGAGFDRRLSLPDINRA